MILKKQSGIKNVLLSLLTLSFFIFNFFSCKDNTVDPPPDNKPPGYQEDIPWPSLGDTPWPTTNADMQRTGRSKYVGPQQGVIATKVKAAQMQSGIAFGNDSVFYFGTSARGVDTTMLVAAKIDGTILWSLDLQALETTTTPLVDKDGTIYIANGYYRKIYAVNPNGTINWIYETEREVFNRGLGLGKDGTLYALENGSTLLAISNSGILLWKLLDLEFGAGSRINLTFSPDGKTLYIPGNRVGTEITTLLAFDLSTKSVKWKFGHQFLNNGPMIDSKGNIYLFLEGDSTDVRLSNFYSLDPNGNIRWKYTHGKSVIGDYDIDPTIDKDGNIYFATDTLFAVNYSGELRWKLFLGGNNFSPLICDAQGNIYLASFTGFSNWKLQAVSREGIIKWSIPITDEFAPGQCPAITKDGTLIYTTWRSRNLFIIK